MKVSDNLLRSISFYYTEMTPTQYIIKSDIILFKNHEMILKSLQISDMISKLTKAATTEAEKNFYSRKSTVEEFNKELAKERKINPGPATIKELIIGTGIVYPPCLKYFYNALTKGELTTIDLPKLAESIFITHKKLAELLSKLGGSATQVSIADLQVDLAKLDREATNLYNKIKDTTTDVQSTNTSISKIKETLNNTLKNIQTNTTNTQDTEEIQQNLDNFYQEVNNNINKQVKEALEKQETTLKETVAKAITEQLESTSTKELRTYTQDTLKEKIGILLSSIKIDLEKDISNAGSSTSTTTELESISTKIQNLTKNTNKLAEDTTIADVEKDLYKLAGAVYKLYTDNKDRAAAMEMDIVNISNSLKIPTEIYQDEHDDYE